jgi:acylphosphatase
MMMQNERKQYEIRIYGRVQGVGFRFAARNKATELGLHGWVENLRDGSVRCAVQGAASSCNAFIRWCNTGTGYSWVERTEVTEKEPEVLHGFRIRY